MVKFVFLLCLSVYFVVAKHEQYDGHTLYNVDVKSVDQTEFLAQLSTKLYLDVWSEAIPGRSGQILVSKEQKVLFQGALQTAGIDFNVEVENIKEKLELEDALLSAAKTKSSRSRTGGLSFDTIHTYEVVDAYIEELARTYPDTVTLVYGGDSVEGRPIKYLKISNTNFEDEDKPIVFLQSLLHAREWVTLPTTLYAIEKLVIDVQEQDLLDDVDWIILPVANPDGYTFTHENTRFWRKNRARGFTIGDACMGVDLNRNFDINWGTASSSNVCTETFHGRGPFSEPETAVIRDIFSEYGNRIGMFLDIHSHGSMILYGYGNGQFSPNVLLVNLLGVNMAQAIDRVKWPTNRDYIVGNANLVLYATSGSASDYGMAKLTSEYAYTVELPSYRNSGGLNGFLVDPDFIEQAGFETWEGIKVGARFVSQRFARDRALKNSKITLD